MRRVIPFTCLLLAGCSNAPVAGFLDTCFPSHAKSGTEPGPAPRPPYDPIIPSPGPTTGPAPRPGPDTPLPPPDFGPSAPPGPGN